MNQLIQEFQPVQTLLLLCLQKCSATSLKPCILEPKVNTKAALWHYRLGHPSEFVLDLVLKDLHVPNANKLDFYTACQDCKYCQQPFPSSMNKTSSPLQLVHSDLWGPAPLLSNEGFRYYIHFVDDFTRFTWIYPLHTKSEAKTAFLHFQSFVERQFDKKIKCLQTDWGGEYQRLLPYLNQVGIAFSHPCPHTHQQNGKAEKKTDSYVGLTFLAQARMPLQYRWDSFSTVVYLINRLPTPVLNHLSPFEVLFKQKPNYHFLKSFSCACYLLL